MFSILTPIISTAVWEETTDWMSHYLLLLPPADCLLLCLAVPSP